MRLRHTSLRRLNETIAALYRRALSEEPLHGIVAAVNDLIGGGVACTSVFSPGCGYFTAVTDRVIESRLAVEVPLEMWNLHPMLKRRTNTVRTLSEVYTPDEWDHHDFREAMRDILRYEDEMGMDLLLPHGGVFSLCITREKRDFQEEHRWLMELLIPHLRVILTHRQSSPTAQQIGEKTDLLTRREHDVLLWLREGKTNSELATILGISPATVKRHLENLYGKLEVGNRIAAIRFVPEEGTMMRESGGVLIALR